MGGGGGGGGSAILAPLLPFALPSAPAVFALGFIAFLSLLNSLLVRTQISPLPFFPSPHRHLIIIIIPLTLNNVNIFLNFRRRFF